MVKPLIPRHHFTLFGREDAARPLNYLDVGCGNHMPSVTKRRFPKWNYFGIDRADYNVDEADKAAMAGYFEADLSIGVPQDLPDGFFDIIVMSHVIEHLPNGVEVVVALAEKLKPGGRLYVEFPSVRSLSLPSMYGTLNFCDDPSHVHVHDVREIANALLSRGFRIIKAGRRRQWSRIFLLPLVAATKLMLRGRLEAGDYWDLMGFADYVFARKQEKA